MLVAVVAPFFTSFILRTFAWSQILADEGWVAGALNFLHLLPGGHIINTPLAVIAGLTYNFLPFMVLPIYASLEKIPRSLIEASRDARMLVVGSRGVGGLREMVLGSVSDQCVRHAPCPVTVVHSPESHRERLHLRRRQGGEQVRARRRRFRGATADFTGP